MSKEKIKNNHESSNREKELLNSKELADKKDKLKEKVESESKRSKNEHEEDIEKIRSKINKETEKKLEKKTNPAENEEDKKSGPLLVNKELKEVTYKRTLKKVQKKLPPTSRAFSKIIHQPTVERISEIGSKTVARPSGILSGGISAFILSSALLWTSKHYGYRYNFLMVFILFAAGFLIGPIVEAFFRIIIPKKSKK